MKNSSLLLAMASGLLLFNPLRELAGNVRVNLPATARTVQAAELISRVGHAVLDHLAGCSVGDARRIANAIISDAVIEYALAKPDLYLTVDAHRQGSSR